MNGRARLLVLGDGISIALITLLGFAAHGELSLSSLPRMLVTFLPLALSWFLLAPWLRLFDPGISANPRQAWRPVLGMLFAAPLAAVLRGLLLGAVVLPLFVAVLAGTGALSMLAWRTIYWFSRNRPG
jgi:hypothetical protein